MKTKVKVAKSSGNVFRDLGMEVPEESLAKAELAAKIANAIASQELTQASAAKLLGVDQPKVSALLRGRLDGFSTERLIKFLTALGRDVEIVVRPHHGKGRGSLHVVES